MWIHHFASYALAAIVSLVAVHGAAAESIHSAASSTTDTRSVTRPVFSADMLARALNPPLDQDRFAESQGQGSPTSNRRRGRAAKIVIGLALAGAGAYMIATSRAWVHDVTDYSSRTSAFAVPEFRTACKASKPELPPPSTDPRVMVIPPLGYGDRCRLWPQSLIAGGLFGGAAGLLFSAFR